jgi:hypothetical protein
LDDLGAQSDLAEAHLQLGLTYQAQATATAAQTHLVTAAQRFEAIQAPRQVAKVQAVLRG